MHLLAIGAVTFAFGFGLGFSCLDFVDGVWVDVISEIRGVKVFQTVSDFLLLGKL